MRIRKARLAVLALPLVLGLPLAAAAQSAGAPCSLLSRTGQHYSETPLAADPATSSGPLPAAPAGADAALVLCRRPTIVPEVSDYRVPAEAHLPLVITDERTTVLLDVVDGRLQLNVRRGQPSPDEAAELKSRLAEMQSAMQAQGAAPKP